MSERDPRTVFVAENSTLADAVIQLLAANGVAAQLGPVAPVEASALTGMTEAAEEFPILVTDAEQVETARELLASAEKMAHVRALTEKRAARTGNVVATCEDCGKASEWPASSMGTTEVCPHCGNYMDVPDPDEDWSGVDFGEPEGDEGDSNDEDDGKSKE